MTATDEHFMELALRLGRRNMGATAENPSVGCIIVAKGLIVGRGVTAEGGRPHAETQALRQAGAKARGAAVYVTLEPCAHYGVTAPCCDALIAAGVGRVVIALTDPDPRTAGAGIACMRAAGIVVETRLCEAAARSDLAGFLSRIERGRPWTVLKLAVSADGTIAEAPGVQTAITGEQALRRSQMMRARSDAILVGAGTLRADDPSLTCRLPGLEDRSPVRVVVGASADDLAGSKLAATTEQVAVWNITARPVVAGGEVVNISCRAGEDGLVDLRATVEELAGRGIGRLLVEGGAQLAKGFLQADLVDRIVLFTSPDKLGEGGVKAPLELIDGPAFVRNRSIMLGCDGMTVYDRAEIR